MCHAKCEMHFYFQFLCCSNCLLHYQYILWWVWFSERFWPHFTSRLSDLSARMCWFCGRDNVAFCILQCLRSFLREYIRLPWWSHDTADSKVHGANMGPIWDRQDPCGHRVGHMNLAMWDGKDVRIVCPLWKPDMVDSLHKWPMPIMRGLFFYFLNISVGKWINK